MAKEKSPSRLVLVVDDEPLIRWSLAECLAAAGYGVMHAQDRQSALDQLTRAPEPGVDVVLLDMKLPDSDDLGLLQAITSRGLARHVILMTACPRPDTSEAAAALGAYRVVGKPFDLLALVELVNEASEARAAA